MAYVFVVGGTNSATFAAAQQLLVACEELLCPPTRRWEMLLCHLAHGGAYHEMEAAMRRQSFTLYHGYPWSHVQCQAQMRRRFPDALWVLAPRDHVAAACINADCTHPEDAALLVSEFTFTTLEHVKGIMRPRLTPAPYNLPCACTVVPIIDCGSEWMVACFDEHSEVRETSCFKPIADTYGTDAADVLRVYVDWKFETALKSFSYRNIAWICESEPIVPGCLKAVFEKSDYFARVACYGGLEVGTGNCFTKVPYGGCWIQQHEIAALPTCKKLPLTSIVVSSKRFAPGHIFRHEIVSSMSTHLHVYGSGYGKHIATKFTALSSYMYSVVVENCAAPGYFTEKLLDCLACRCVVFYWGAPDIHAWFLEGSVLPFTSLGNLQELLQGVSVADYTSRMDAIDANQHRSYARRCCFSGLALDTDVLSVSAKNTGTCT